AVPADLQGERAAAGGLGEGERDGVLDVPAALRLCGLRPSPRAGAAAEAGGASAPTSAPAGAEQLLEDVAEIAAGAELAGVEVLDGDVGRWAPLPATIARAPAGPAAERLERVAAGTAAGADSPLDPGVAELVVGLALLRVGENVVRLLYFLELLGGRGAVALVHVRVILAGELAVRLLDLVRTRAARNAQDVVIISLCHCQVARAACPCFAIIAGNDRLKVKNRNGTRVRCSCYRYYRER